MAKLAMTREFLAGFHKLDKPLQKAVSAAFEKFAAHTHAGLHLEKIGAKLTKLTKAQAEYLGVPVEGPYKPEHYRY